MAYDDGLAHRIRELTEDDPTVVEKKMFGGLCFLVSGNMCCGVVRDELMLRVGPESYAECLGLPHAREMDFTGRAMKGMIYVSTDGFEEDEDLEAWVGRGLEFARSLPPKEANATTKKPKAATKHLIKPPSKPPKRAAQAVKAVSKRKSKK